MTRVSLLDTGMYQLLGMWVEAAISMVDPGCLSTTR